ncbi:MAG: gamma-glutamyl-gamma-aminobutyrate hydrolase family protein [Methylophaga sp.]
MEGESEDGWDHSSLENWLEVIQPKALVLSGGNDIGEYPARDKTEKYLLDWANSHKIPLLGICRGMQMMSHWAGGQLVPVKGHVRVRHQLVQKVEDVIFLPDSVNSYHNFSIETCPEPFEVMAEARDDGVIEAIRHKTLPWEGWMWHPEREKSFNGIDTLRVKRLFSGK